MGAYLEFQDLVLGLFEQAGLEAYTVHDYIDTEQLGRRWDLMCRHEHHFAGGEDIVTTVSIRLNSLLEVLLEEASALDWEPGEDLNLGDAADGEVEIETRLAGDLVGGAVQPLWDILQASLKEGGAFDQLGLVREERTRSDGGGMESTVRVRLAAYPEPQDFCRDSFWAAAAKVLSDTLDLLYRQFPEDSPAGPS